MGSKANIGTALMTLSNKVSPYIQAQYQFRLAELERKQRLKDLLTQKGEELAMTGDLVPAPTRQVGTTIDRLSLLPGMQDKSGILPSYPSKIQDRGTYQSPISGQNYVPKPTRTKWEPATQQEGLDYLSKSEKIKTDEEIRKENAKNKNIQDTVIAPEGFEVTGYSAQGKPIIKKIDQDKIKQKQQATEYIRSTAQDTLDTIGEVEKGINHFGLTGGIPSIPGTDRYVWQSNINKLLSGKMIDLMTKMKEASKTGATGFGQLSEREDQILRDASTALKRGLPPAEAQKLLNKMKIPLQKILTQGENNANKAATIQNQILGQQKPTQDQFQIGQTIQKGGKTYKYIGNNQWSY